MTKVVIVGAGPSGVLLAHYLLRRGNHYQIDLYERRSDPRTLAFSTARTFPISLNDRGTDALYQIAEVEDAVKAISLEMSGTIFHQANGKTRTTTRKKPLVTLDRTNLVILLLEKLTQTYDQTRLKLHFNHQCTQVDLAAKTVSFQPLEADIAAHSVDYDLLVGADGAHSTVRNALLTQDLFEFEQKYVSNDYKSIYLAQPDRHPNQFDRHKIHSWRMNDGTFVVLLHLHDGSMGGVILFPRQNEAVSRLSTPAEVLQFFQQHFPEVGELMTEAEAQAFLERPLARILMTRCSQFHYQDSVLLLGDAVHSVSPAIGQGCNSALEDVFIFDRLLNQYSDNLAQSLQQFTLQRRADAHALVELSDNAFPSSTRLFGEFVLREQVAKLLHQLFPKRFSPSLSQLVFETTVPYAEILGAYQGWIRKVKRSKEVER